MARANEKERMLRKEREREREREGKSIHVGTYEHVCVSARSCARFSGNFPGEYVPYPKDQLLPWDFAGLRVSATCAAAVDLVGKSSCFQHDATRSGQWMIHGMA